MGILLCLRFVSVDSTSKDDLTIFPQLAIDIGDHASIFQNSLLNLSKVTQRWLSLFGCR